MAKGTTLSKKKEKILDKFKRNDYFCLSVLKNNWTKIAMKTVCN